MKTIDRKFSELCEEIDFWKGEAKRYKNLYEIEVEKNVDILNKQLKDSQRGVANALMLALSINDNKDGSLSISSEDRKRLSKNIKTK